MGDKKGKIQFHEIIKVCCEKMKGIYNGNILLAVLFLGIFLMIFNFSRDTGGTTNQEESKEQEVIYNHQKALYETDTEYLNDMEKKLVHILSQMEGVGEVEVMISLKESSERVIEKDVEETSETDQDDQGNTKSSSKKESTIFYGNQGTLSWGSDNESESEPYIRKEKVPVVEGVVVVADGGDSPVIIKNITESVQALFGIETHKIRIVKKIS